ncbi:MAG: hypothetical protein ACYC0X_13180 [Pirellulaceae bacterium]
MLQIIFEFVGGPNDGNVLHGAIGEPTDAERYYLFSNHGTVGHRFKVASQYAVETLASEQLKDERPHYFQRHYYAVTDRLEEGGEVWVRAEYVPEAVESRRPSS